MGASNFTGALADFLAAVDGSSLGGGKTAAAALDRQVVDWLREMTVFPEGSSGTLTSGGSMAGACRVQLNSPYPCERVMLRNRCLARSGE